MGQAWKEDNSTVVFAVDLGGTNIRGAMISDDGEIVRTARQKTPEGLSPKGLIALVTTLFEECGAGHGGTEPLSVGIGVPANVNASGMLRHLPNIQSLEGFDLKKELECELALPVAVENDAIAACIGERWKGASKGIENSILVTLGTGVGGGLIIDGKVLRGPDGGAGKIGHITIEPDGHPCGCGSRGCIEQYASAPALVRMARDAGFDIRESRSLFEAWGDGDPIAADVFARMGRYLGIALAGLINILNPDIIVIGGGVAAGYDAFIEPLRAEISYRAFAEPAIRAKIVRSQLGDDAGILGAAKSALDMACNDGGT